MNNTYDVKLLFGQMYHLFTADDQLQALSEAIRVTKKGGSCFPPTNDAFKRITLWS